MKTKLANDMTALLSAIEDMTGRLSRQPNGANAGGLSDALEVAAADLSGAVLSAKERGEISQWAADVDREIELAKRRQRAAATRTRNAPRNAKRRELRKDTAALRTLAADGFLEARRRIESIPLINPPQTKTAKAAAQRVERAKSLGVDYTHRQSAADKSGAKLAAKVGAKKAAAKRAAKAESIANIPDTFAAVFWGGK